MSNEETKNSSTLLEKSFSHEEGPVWDITEDDLRSLLAPEGKLSKSAGKRELKKIKKTIEELAKLRALLKEGASSEELLELVKQEGPLTQEVEFIDFLLNQGDELSQFLSLSSKKTVRQPRDLIDNKLSTSTKSTQEPTLFDYLEKKSLSTGLESSTHELFVPSLDLEPSEEKLVHTLSVLLGRRSERNNQSSPKYYMGNYEKGIVNLAGVVEEEERVPQSKTVTKFDTARLVISPHELFSTYLGRENYSGDNSKFILKTLENLSKKNFLVSLTIPSADGKYQKLRTYISLYQIVVLNRDLSKSESQDIDSNEKLIEGKNSVFLFKFSPLFTNNIRERYIEVPEDLHLRITKASGKRTPQSALLLKDLLLREKQLKRFSIVRDEETLIDVLKLRKMRDEGRKKKVDDYLTKAFQICTAIGLLKSVTRSKGKRFQSQYIFEINEKFC